MRALLFVHRRMQPPDRAARGDLGFEKEAPVRFFHVAIQVSDAAARCAPRPRRDWWQPWSFRSRLCRWRWQFSWCGFLGIASLENGPARGHAHRPNSAGWPLFWSGLGFESFDALADVLQSPVETFGQVFEESGQFLRLTGRRKAGGVRRRRRRGNARRPLPTSEAGGLEAVSTTSSAAASSAERAGNTALVQSAGNRRATTKSGAASRPGTLSEWTCSISKWHFRFLLFAKPTALVRFPAWLPATAAPSPARTAPSAAPTRSGARVGPHPCHAPPRPESLAHCAASESCRPWSPLAQPGRRSPGCSAWPRLHSTCLPWQC